MSEPEARSFFFDVAPARWERHELLDVHVPPDGAGEPKPAVLFVHGGPVSPEHQPPPRDWEGNIGYGALAAASGLVGITFNHRLYDMDTHYAIAADDVAEVVERTRALDCVAEDRIALWFFSAGGGLGADFLFERPDWLRCVAWTYPVLVPPPEWPEGRRARFDTVSAASAAKRLPKLLLRVGDEYEYFEWNQDVFVDTLRTHDSDLEVIELPEAEHGFEHLGYVQESRAAVDRAMSWIASRLLR